MLLPQIGEFLESQLLRRDRIRGLLQEQRLGVRKEGLSSAPRNTRSPRSGRRPVTGSPGMSLKEHFYPFPEPRLNDRCLFS